MLSLTWGEAQLESEPSLNLQWNSCDSEKSKGPLELSMPAIACYSCSLAVHVDNRSAFLRGTTEEFWWGMRCHFGPLTCLCKLYERLRRIYPPILVPELTNETWTRLFWSLFWDACWRQQPNGCKGTKGVWGTVSQWTWGFCFVSCIHMRTISIVQYTSYFVTRVIYLLTGSCAIPRFLSSVGQELQTYFLGGPWQDNVFWSDKTRKKWMIPSPLIEWEAISSRM